MFRERYGIRWVPRAPRGKGEAVDLGWRDARPLAWLSLEGALVGT